MSFHRHRLLALFLLTAPLAMAPASALAQGEENMALKNYEKAKQAYGAGEFELAADLLQKAYAEDPDLIYQYNRIRALQAMGNYDEALETIDLFRGPMSRDKEQRFTDLDDLEAQIRAEKIEFEKNKPPEVKQDPVVEKDPVVEPDPNKEDPVEPPVVDADPGKGKRTVGWILLGTGAGAILGTAGHWSGYWYSEHPCFEANARNSEDASCFNGGEVQESYDEQLLRDRIIGGVGLGVGSALAITGLILVVTNGKPDEAESSSVSFSPTLSPSQVGASMRFDF